VRARDETWNHIAVFSEIVTVTLGLTLYHFKGTVKVHCRTEHEGPGGVEVWLYCFFTLGAGRGGWSTPHPGRFTPRKDPEPIV
jgi:hypothetical protein